MDRIRRARYAVTLFACVLVALAAVALAVFCLRPGDAPDDASEPVDEELVAMTNYISREFAADGRDSHFGPCVYAVEEALRTMTNASRQLIIARYLAKESLSVNYTNANYQMRWRALEAVDSLIFRTYECLWIAGVDASERCKFLFDSLLNFKMGAIVTIDDSGKCWALHNCKAAASDALSALPSYFWNWWRRYRPDSSELDNYVSERFREVFGIEYIPFDESNPRYLWGLDGTRWDGKGIEWR